MSKVVTIPKDRNPFVVIVNGIKHSYPAGETIEVPDAVADVIERYEGAKPKPDPDAGKDKYSGGASTWEDLGSKYENGVVLAECSPTMVDGDGGMYLFPLPKFKLIEGAEYTVNWNGTPFTCVCSFMNMDGVTGLGLGNIGAMTDGVTTGEPFVLGVFDDPTAIGVPAAAVPLDGSATLTVSITGPIEIITPVPDKYLPFVKPYVIDLNKDDAGDAADREYGGKNYLYVILLDTTELYKVMVNHGNIYFRISTNSGYVRHVQVSSYFFLSQNLTLEEYAEAGGDISKLPLQLGAYEPWNDEYYFVNVNTTD